MQSIQIIGRLAAKPELRYTQTGQEMASFRVAVNNRFTREGVSHETTQWYSVGVYGRQASHCLTYLDKGSQVHVSGRLNATAYMTRESTPAASLHIHATSVEFIGNKPNPQGAYDDSAAVNPPYQTTEPTWDPEDIFAEPQGAAV